jgi:hypothetical protein
MIIQQSNLPAVASYKAPAASAPESEKPQSADVVELKSSKVGRGFAVVGGGLAGVAAAAVSNVAVVAASREMLKLVANSLPHSGNPLVGHILQQALDLTSTAQPALLIAAGALGAAAGARAGGAIAYEAASGATKLDLAKTPPPVIKHTFNVNDLLAAHRESGAELRQHLGEVRHAHSTAGAVGDGFQAATCLLGPSAGAAGKVQGALLGFVVGGTVGIPLLSLVNHPAMLLPTAIAGSLLGSKIGAYLGYAAGTAASGVVGAAGGAVAHGTLALTGHRN